MEVHQRVDDMKGMAECSKEALSKVEVDLAMTRADLATARADLTLEKQGREAKAIKARKSWPMQRRGSRRS